MFSTLSYASFYNVWYWVLTILVWTQVCNRTLGVPYDMILRAERLPAVAAEVDAVAAAAARRLAAIHRAAAGPLAAAAGFCLAGLAVLGLAYRVEAALAVLMILLPLAVVAALGVRLALQVERSGARGRELRRRLARRRAWNQATAVLALLASTFAALLHHPALVLLRW